MAGLIPGMLRRGGYSLLVAMFVSLGTGSAEADHRQGIEGIAIEGYDTVAYFTEGRAVEGTSEFRHKWSDVWWHFRNAAHRDLFASDPERYAPRFAGFCAMGIADGKVVRADPQMWTIVDGKLYLKHSKKARERWREDPAANIERGEENWVALAQPYR